MMKRFKIFMEAEPSKEDVTDPNAEKGGYTTTDGTEIDQSITGNDPDDAVEDEIEKQEDAETESAETRLLGIDKRKMNKIFGEMSANPVDALPVKAVCDILNKYGLKMVDEDGDATFEKLTGVDGNIDFDLVEIATNKHINNSMGIIQWHKNDDATYNFNYYLG